MDEDAQNQSEELDQSEVLYRSFDISQRNIDEDTRTVELSFSSDTPVRQWFGDEILDHSPGAVRMERMTDGAPLLMDHNTRDQIGVVESARIEDGRGRATVRFGESARAEEIFRDVVGKIRRCVSVGYRVWKAVLEEENEDGPDLWRVVDWQPLEVSIVSVPADASVGVGRSHQHDKNTVRFVRHIDSPPAEVPEPIPPTERSNPVEDDEVEITPDVEAIRSEEREQERTRVREITALGRQFDMATLADEFIDNGRGVDQFQSAVLERLGQNETPADVSGSAADIGMTDGEVQRFSVVRLVRALMEPTNRRFQREAEFEFACSEAIDGDEFRDFEGTGFRIPNDVIRQPLVNGREQRDLSVGTATAGGHTVATDLLAQSFIELLRNRMRVRAAGATVLTGLVGNIAIPRQTAGATAYWVAEAAAPTESQQAFDQVTMSPETVGAFTDFSRKLMLQSSIDVEAMVRRDLATVLALEIDRVAINGSGSSNEPEGILNATGIGDVAGGTNGAAPDWDDIVNLESEVAADNADVGALQYMVNAVTRGVLKRTAIEAGDHQRIWPVGSNQLNGYDVQVTNQVPSNLTKGSGTNLSAILYGNWADLFIGEWGGLSLLVDPYTASTSGTVRVVALQDVDVALRHAESFAAMQDAITT